MFLHVRYTRPYGTGGVMGLGVVGDLVGVDDGLGGRSIKVKWV